MNKRPFIGILFRCCHAYGRGYLNPERTAFVARCPRCAQVVRVGVSPTGTRDRFFSAG